jgi:hypothetical protein
VEHLDCRDHMGYEVVDHHKKCLDPHMKLLGHYKKYLILHKSFFPSIMTSENKYLIQKDMSPNQFVTELNSCDYIDPIWHVILLWLKKVHLKNI